MKSHLYTKNLVCTKLLFIGITLLFSQGSKGQCWQSVSVGNTHTIALTPEGSLWTWGLSSYGLGDGSVHSNIPKQLGTDTDWKFISTENKHSFAIKTDGSLWGWGYNWSGQLGNGTNTDLEFLTRIGTDTDWDWVSSGPSHSVGIKTDGSLWAWGSNVKGELGNGGSENSHLPIHIISQYDSTKWEKAFAGEIFTIAIKTDGTLWTWGHNSGGQLGDGTTTEKRVPFKIGSDTDWATIATGYQHVIAIKTDGTLWAWGINNFGQLGDGTNSQRITPTQIGTDTDWKAVDAGVHHTLTTKTDGTLWAWGLNGAGSVGDNTIINRNAPVQIGMETDWQSVSAGNLQSKALKTDGNIWAWGYNNSGQVGNGPSTGSVRTPVLTNCAVLSLDVIEQSVYSVYPNPVSNILTIETPVGANYKLKVINQLGQLVLRQNKNTSSSSLDVSTLSKGLYFLNINSENDGKQTVKFIKN
ncbi:T9SS type A sorting domain-containing protein [Gelidibacter pelagius]|uniref:T9SS type A sorting domain-containing protein n=1 Tax=Gelidibacter pelagius TaxID=2819985 RepID=A0ABS3STY7_9FLAO|nr:T9SS type A sorting domain-containing protein [Gelidibacter pelagius]MBO3099164.1 T9SS type A sorting domain-containing protein [Gelidibacter pelagius]